MTPDELVRAEGPLPGGWFWIVVGDLRLRRVRNPKTVAAWVERFRAAPDPVAAARAYLAAVREKAATASWQGAIVAHLSNVFPDLQWYVAYSGTYYGSLPAGEHLR